MTRIEIDQDIDTKITNKTEIDSITPAEDGANRKAILDYVDEKISEIPVGVKTSSAYALTATQQVLTSDFNFCSFGGGKAFLPTTTEIGKQIYVAAVSPNIEIYGNEANENKVFLDLYNISTKVILNTNDMYRFTYVGVTGGWKAELLSSSRNLAKTSGDVNASVAPFQTLPFSINHVNTYLVNQGVLLPYTTEIGKEIIILAINSGDSTSFKVQGNLDGTVGLALASISSVVYSFDMLINTSYRFTYVGNETWKAEII